MGNYMWESERRRQMRQMTMRALLTGLVIGIPIGMILGRAW